MKNNLKFNFSKPIFGSHSGCFLESEEDWLFPVIEFLRIGYETQGKMVCCIGLFNGEKILGSFRLMGIEPAPYLLRGDMKMVSNRDSFFQGDKFNQSLLEKFVENFYDETEQKGYPNLRFVFDMVWLGGSSRSAISSSLDFARKMLKFRGLKKTSFLFLYDLSTFPAEKLAEALEIHQYVFIRGAGGENFFHVPAFDGSESSAQAGFKYRCDILTKHFAAGKAVSRTGQMASLTLGGKAEEAAGSMPAGSGAPPGPMETLKKAAYVHSLEILFGADLSIQKIFVLLLQEAKNLSGSSTGFVGTFERESGKLMLRAKDPLFQDECQIVSGPGRRCIRLKPEGLMAALCRQVFESGTGFISDNLMGLALAKGLPHHLPGLEQMLFVPIISGKEKLGIVALGNPSAAYGEADLAQIADFAKTFGRILHQHRLSENLEILEKAVGQIIEAVVITGLEGKIISWNPNFEDLIKIPGGQIAEKNIFSLLFPGGREEIPIAILEALQKSNYWKGPGKTFVPDMTSVDLDISISTIVQEVEDRTVLVWAIRQASRVSSGEKGGVSAEGEKGEGDGQEFRRGEILSEFQRTLTLILGNVEMLPLSFENIDSNQENIREIRSAVDRARSLVNSIKTKPG